MDITQRWWRVGCHSSDTATFGYNHASGGGSWTYSLGPEAVFYLGEQSASVRPFVRADIGIGRRKSSATGPYGSSAMHVNLSHFGAGAGMLDLLTSSVGIYGEIFYRRDSYGADLDNWADEFGVAFGFSLFLGG